MTQIKRRGFLGGIAAALATTPEKVLKATGVSPTQIGREFGIRSGEYAVPTAAETISGGLPWWKAERARIFAMRTFAPWLLEKKRRANAHHVSYLDINIASLRSVSPAAKIAMQRELQYRRQLDEELERLILTAEDRDFTA